MNKKGILEFLRAQFSAFISTCIDYGTFIGLTQLVGSWYIFANIVAASLGAITNFLLGRYWIFNAQQSALGNQMGKYALVSIGSLILNTLILYGLTERMQFAPIYSKIIGGILVGVFFNFLLQKHFVFKASA